jgi:hypothetical protein
MESRTLAEAFVEPIYEAEGYTGKEKLVAPELPR